MNTAAKLLNEIATAGCHAHVDGDTLRLNGPRPLPSELMEQLREHKPELLALLASAPSDWGTSLTEDDLANISEAIEERAAIQEYDGELTRVEAEKQAHATIHIYHYRLTDQPTNWLVMIAPGCDLAEATRSAKLMFGAERVIEVRRHQP